MSTTILADVLKKAIAEKDRLELENVNVLDKEHASSIQFLQDFSMRFPAEFWSDAWEYFRVK
jgi:hypothetical protein